MSDDKPPSASSEARVNEADLIEGRDYTLDPQTGDMILTADYLMRRGYCCGSGCRNCPYERNR